MEQQTHKGFRMISYDRSHPLWAAGSSSPFHLPGFLGENHMEVHAHSAPGNRQALCDFYLVFPSHKPPPATPQGRNQMPFHPGSCLLSSSLNIFLTVPPTGRPHPQSKVACLHLSSPDHRERRIRPRKKRGRGIKIETKKDAKDHQDNSKEEEKQGGRTAPADVKCDPGTRSKYGHQGEHPSLNQPLPRRPRWHTGGKEWLPDKEQKTKPICEKHTCL